MKKAKSTLFVLVLTAFFIVSSGWVLAKTRNIYIGDLIEIKVTVKDMTTQELRDKFKDFEIVDMKEEGDSHRITLRSFEPGEKTVQIGDKEMKFNIKSTLKEINKVGIYEGDLNPKTADVSFGWKYVFFALSGIFLMTGGLTLWRVLKRKRTVSLSPYQRFINVTNTASPHDKDYLVNLTAGFKEYLEERFPFPIKGKTSSEIIHTLGSVAGDPAISEGKQDTQPDIRALLPEIKRWLLESDQYKFTGIPVSAEKKQTLLEELVELVRKMEDTSGVKI